MRRAQRLFAWLYERYGMAGLVPVIVAGAVTSAALNVLAVVASFAGYAHLSLEDTLRYTAFAEAVMLVALFAGVMVSRDFLRLALSWSGAGRTAHRAPELWRAAIRGPRQVVTSAAVAIVLLETVPVSLAVAEFDLPLYVGALLVLVVGASTAANAIFVMFGIEFALRPAIKDAAALLPPDFEPDAPTWSLSAKALIPLPGAFLFTGLLVGAFADSTEGPGPRVATALGLSLGAAVIGLALFLVATRSALGPIDELTAATRRVREGDLATPVPVVSADELGVLAHSFNQMLVGLREREALRADLRDSRARIVATADAERRRLERDLHDGAQQHLVLLGLKLGMAKRSMQTDPQAAAGLLDELSADLTTALKELRDLAHGIYPALLENEGLPGALREAAERSPIPASFECADAGRYAPEVEAAIYFCCREALQNAAKHAGEGATATVEVAAREGALHFAVCDDGQGFDGSPVGDGLQNMRDRIGALGGTLDVRSARGEGTTVTGSIPLAPDTRVETNPAAGGR